MVARMARTVSDVLRTLIAGFNRGNGVCATRVAAALCVRCSFKIGVPSPNTRSARWRFPRRPTLGVALQCKFALFSSSYPLYGAPRSVLASQGEEILSLKRWRLAPGDSMAQKVFYGVSSSRPAKRRTNATTRALRYYVSERARATMQGWKPVRAGIHLPVSECSVTGAPLRAQSGTGQLNETRARPAIESNRSDYDRAMPPRRCRRRIRRLVWLASCQGHQRQHQYPSQPASEECPQHPPCRDHLAPFLGEVAISSCSGWKRPPIGRWI